MAFSGGCSGWAIIGCQCAPHPLFEETVLGFLIGRDADHNFGKETLFFIQEEVTSNFVEEHIVLHIHRIDAQGF